MIVNQSLVIEKENSHSMYQVRHITEFAEVLN